MTIPTHGNARPRGGAPPGDPHIGHAPSGRSPRGPSARPRLRLSATALLLVVGALLHAGPAAAQQGAVDLTGAWVFTVVTENGTGTPDVMLSQDGTDVTGTYSSPRLGTRRLVGALEGDTLTFRLAPGEGGADVIMVFSAVIQPDGTMAGTVDFGGMGGATFTAARAGTPGDPRRRVGAVPRPG